MKILDFIRRHEDKFFLHYPVALLIVLNCLTTLLVAVIVAIVLIILKELYDKYKKKTYISWGDIIAGIGGVITGVILRLWMS